MARSNGDGSIYQLSDGRWRAQIVAGYLPSGRLRYVTRTTRTRQEAARALRALLLAAEAGEALQPAGRDVTVSTWAARWLEARDGAVRSSTWGTDASMVRRWIVPTIGARRLATLTPADVRAVTAAAAAADRSPATQRALHGLVLRMLRAAWDEGHAVPERARATRHQVRRVESTRDAIPDDDTRALLAAARRTPHGSRWTAAFLTGIRQAEALGLTWECVDLAAGVLDIRWQIKTPAYRVRGEPASGWRIPTGQQARHLYGGYHLTAPKPAAGRRLVPIPGALVDQLAAWRAIAPESPWGLVWPGWDGREGRGVPVVRSAAMDRADWHALQDVAQVASCDGRIGRRYLIHEIRHTAATLLLAAGTDPHVMSAMMGHSHIVTTRGYQHVSQDMARGAAEAMSRRLGLG